MRYIVCILLSCLIIAGAFHFAKPLPQLPQKEEFLPMKPDEFFIYVCGPTV